MANTSEPTSPTTGRRRSRSGTPAAKLGASQVDDDTDESRREQSPFKRGSGSGGVAVAEAREASDARAGWPLRTIVALALLAAAVFAAVRGRSAAATARGGEGRLGGSAATNRSRGSQHRKVALPDLSAGAVLWVVRTFHGHGMGLKKLLTSLIAMRNRNWVALLLNTDIKPYPLMAEIVDQLGDERIIVISPVAASKFSYFEAGYSATDNAVQYAKSLYGDTIRWVVSTNGDNYYESDFLSVLDPSVDVIGVDFFCRWDDFSLEASRVSTPQRCKLNTFQRGMTDLGANIWNFHRWVAEDVSFSWFTPTIDHRAVDAAPKNLRPVLAGAMASQDGQMAEFLVFRRGWKAKSVHRCLFSHSPNPWECKLSRGVWLDSPLRLESDCLEQEEVAFLEGMKLVEVTRQTDDFPDYARFSQSIMDSKFKEGCQVELDLERWVGELSKLVKTEGCPEICFKGCSHPGVTPKTVPCDANMLFSDAQTAGWAFDAEFYGNNPLSPDLRPLPLPDREVHFKNHGLREGRCHRFTHPKKGIFSVGCINKTESGAPPPRGRPGVAPLPNMLARVLVEGLKLRGWA